MEIKLNKKKSIGNVLFIVEGNKTEPFLLRKIFTRIFDYDYQDYLRTQGNQKPYHQYNSKVNPTSKVFVINTENSNIKCISKDNEYLNNLFAELIEKYHFDVDNSAIYYLFDRDDKSNTDKHFFEFMLDKLQNSRDNKGYDRPGVLLLNYPSVESFTLSNFSDKSFQLKFRLGDELKNFLDDNKINHCRISEGTIVHAANEMLTALTEIGIDSLDLDNIGESNQKVFDYEEKNCDSESVYQALSLLCIALLDLGLMEEQ